jgi:cytochrome c553
MAISVGLWLVLAGCGNGGGTEAGPPLVGGTFGPMALPPSVAFPAPTPPPNLVPPMAVGRGPLVPGEVVRSSVAPAPINGGTLIVTKDGSAAVAADPDRDRVVIVDIKGAQVLGTVQLEPGDEPGRLVEDGAHRVHVVLRRSGQLATISLDDRKLLTRRYVCPVPQGLDYDATADSVLVACTSGELVTLAASGGPATRSVHVDIDLRDVIVAQGRLFVTRFKSAELLELDADAAVISRRAPAALQAQSFEKVPSGDGGPQLRTFSASVAWRALATPDGRISMLHQRGQVEAVALHSAQAPDGGVPMDCSQGCSGSASGPGFPGAPGGGSAYGGSLPCDSIVQSGVSQLGMTDSSVVSGPMLASVTLAVDAAVSPDGQWLAIGVAGSSSAKGFNLPTSPTSPNALVLPTGPAMDASLVGTCLQPGSMPSGVIVTGQVVAVAFDGAGRLVMQTRDPNRIQVIENPSSCFGCTSYSADVDMGGESRRDTGHDIFHTNAGAGLACASCHPNGGDDGRTWQFTDIGPRRTQLFNMGIRDTLPLHWDGALPTFDSLIQEVFERRMGGPVLASDQISAMSDWLDSLHPNTPMRRPDDPAAARGQVLFESKDAGCTNCHTGPKLTNNTTVDVGTQGQFQVPSLIGVAYHEPYIHTGCAQTLRQRFDPSCGGKGHGNTAGLSEDQLGDLVAYLESL